MLVHILTGSASELKVKVLGKKFTVTVSDCSFYGHRCTLCPLWLSVEFVALKDVDGATSSDGYLV